MREVVIVGAGLAGLTLGASLARSGFSVTIIEVREAPAPPRSAASRSINLAMSARGLRALDALGLTREVMRDAVPMYGRRIHRADADAEFQAYDLIGTRAIYSIARSRLWQLLHAAADTSGARLRFGGRCARVDAHERTIEIVDSLDRRSRLGFDALIGCDGTHSFVRQSLVESGHITEEACPLRHEYMELHVPAELGAELDRHSLHIWPQGDHLLIALPNVDGSFTATLFLPLVPGSAADHRNELPALFRSMFPTATPLFSDLDADLLENRFGRLHASRCHPWSHAGSVLLIGDAAHTMAPFYGQGMNCALEDCYVLARCVERFGGQWEHVFPAFERIRRPDADAITALSEANYTEMSHRVVDRDFMRQREIERALQVRFPGAYVPLYAMISFSTVPYATAVARAAAQAAIVEQLVRALDATDQLDLDAPWLRTAVEAVMDISPPA